ncbi:MAG TPA: tetratricopeptide repeat protein, partial [Polyangiaceae bacterium]
AHDETRFEDAVRHARAAVTIAEEGLGPQHPYVGDYASSLAGVETETGALGDALTASARSLSILEGAVARGELPDHYANFAAALLNTGELYVRLGRPRDAMPLLERARHVYADNHQRDQIVEVDALLAEAWRQLGHLAEATEICTEGRATAEESKDTNPERVAEILIVEANLDLDRGRAADALPLAERALALAEKGALSPYDLSRARVTLARALVRNGRDAARARGLAEDAQRGFAQLKDRRHLEEVSAVLAQMSR